MSHVSHKLENAFEGALAGGGDPATSPLYVFGPFLKLIVVAGVAHVTFGASVWLAVLTIAVVSAMYRLVMQWVTDGSGGSGLSEEEFGGWAAKVNAAITFVEYTLTFLVSMAAMVTFIADRLPILNNRLLGIQYRALVAILLSLLTGWLVNRGPRMAARTFGPATAGVLLLLWAMVLATLWRNGIQLPQLDFRAFTGEFFKFTLGGYVRILAVMTGIEVFANLVAAYEGTKAQRSRKAFNSLLIVMGTTAVTMLIVGPAIFAVSDPSDSHVSVFTQTMDALLPSPLPWLGTLVGIAVLMSASAASAQGLQNLALGLTERGYIPPALGRQNEFGVADRPVWLEIAIVVVCFLFLGTSEETYLALYAAGVFILLSMTGWAVTKRLIREIRAAFTLAHLGLVLGTTVASLLTTTATVLIFEERFLEGAWIYLILVPVLYGLFTYSRRRFGPSTERDLLGQLDAAQLAGFGFGQAPAGYMVTNGNGEAAEIDFTWEPEPKELSRWRQQVVTIQNIVLLLDGSEFADQAVPMGKRVSQATGATIHLLSAVKDYTQALREAFETTRAERERHLRQVQHQLQAEGFQVECHIRPGFIADATQALVEELDIQLVIVTTRGKSGRLHWLRGGVSQKLTQKLNVPILLVQAQPPAAAAPPQLERILVTLDGSIRSEKVLPYARAFAKAFDSELILLCVPEVPEVKNYRAAAGLLEELRADAEQKMGRFLNAIARSLREEGVRVRAFVTGFIPEKTIIALGEQEQVGMTMLTARGRGGLDLLFAGSVARQVVEDSPQAVVLVPVRNHNNAPQSRAETTAQVTDAGIDRPEA